MNTLKILLGVIVIIYLGLCAYLYFTQESQIFERDDATKIKIVPSIKNVKEVSFEVEKGISLYGKHKIAPNSTKPIIIYFGGNSSDITTFFNHTPQLDEYEMISFNYRGYINSGGTPSEKKFFQDAIKIYDRYKNNKEVIVVGRSLGSGVGTYLASKRDVKTLVLLTPYDSIASMAKRKYPIFPIDFLLNHKFESIKYIKEVKSPIVLFEVKGDTTIKKYHFDRLKQEIKNIQNHVVFTNISHGDILKHKDFQEKLKENLK